ncbi:MAG: [FeFe] hydrogenase H-cluster radical SAM maturase HydE [Oscillospiraceae bacterium]|jgi:biotin synthase
MKQLIDKLEQTRHLTQDEWEMLFSSWTQDTAEYLFEKSRALRSKIYKSSIYLRGLIEFTNYCKNDCYYCGIRKSNCFASRYRLSKEETLDCCRVGYDLGFRTFVLQGGEDPYFTDEKICDLIFSIKRQHPDCAVTLSVGEKEKESYLAYYRAGADRYLLRHETADERHYEALHPAPLSAKHRQDCLWTLKEIGYQVGTGFMVGSPHQTPAHLAQDFLFIEKLQPQMVGIGPFIPHHDTPFAHQLGGTAELTLFCIGLLRLLLPYSLLPSTTALGTIDPLGREKGILAGANVVMPNLSPAAVRSKYLLYDNKICTGDEAAECRFCMSNRMEEIGYQVLVDRGDCKDPLFVHKPH